MLKFKSSEQTIWLMSDTHYGHKNIVLGESDWEDKSGCRPFKSVEHMNDAIVKGMNLAIKEDDILFHLGDWSFGGVENIGKFRERLNVKTIHLIAGNHDKHIKTKPELQALFTTVSDYMEIVVDKQLIVLSHYPMCSWNEAFKGSWMLHGHCHGTMFKESSESHWYHTTRILDVGIDTFAPVRGYLPVTYAIISNIMKNRSFIQNDHHDKRTSR